MDIQKVLLRPEEAAEAFGICPRTLRKWVCDHGLPSLTVDGNTRYYMPVCEEWIRTRMQGGTPDAKAGDRSSADA
ncbi:helix-turn-helix domain-containing protein [Blastopirellula sp. J2-11]|uniref:helix-turn-helix domain-containing protein n=1 Tax=Blastopirellula sp. J2-11 TaxID=2943192 RepID=UPI003966E5C2